MGDRSHIQVTVERLQYEFRERKSSLSRVGIEAKALCHDIRREQNAAEEAVERDLCGYCTTDKTDAFNARLFAIKQQYSELTVQQSDEVIQIQHLYSRMHKQWRTFLRHTDQSRPRDFCVRAVLDLLRLTSENDSLKQALENSINEATVDLDQLQVFHKTQMLSLPLPVFEAEMEAIGQGDKSQTNNSEDSKTASNLPVMQAPIDKSTLQENTTQPVSSAQLEKLASPGQLHLSDPLCLLQSPFLPGQLQPSAQCNQSHPSASPIQQHPSAPPDQLRQSAQTRQQHPSAPLNQKHQTDPPNQLNPSAPLDLLNPSSPLDQQKPSAPPYQLQPSAPPFQPDPFSPSEVHMQSQSCPSQAWFLQQTSACTMPLMSSEAESRAQSVTTPSAEGHQVAVTVSSVACRTIPPCRPSVCPTTSSPNPRGYQPPVSPTSSSPDTRGNQPPVSPTASSPDPRGNQPPVSPTSSSPDPRGNQPPVSPTSSSPDPRGNQPPVSPTSSSPDPRGNQPPVSPTSSSPDPRGNQPPVSPTASSPDPRGYQPPVSPTSSSPDPRGYCRCWRSPLLRNIPHKETENCNQVSVPSQRCGGKVCTSEIKTNPFSQHNLPRGRKTLHSVSLHARKCLADVTNLSAR